MTESAPPPDSSTPSRPPPLAPAVARLAAARAPLSLQGGAPSRARVLGVGVAIVAMVVLALAALGLLPAREPVPPKAVAFDVNKTVDPLRLPEHNVATPRVHRLLVWSFPLCARPRQGARMYRVSLRPERDSFVVWCQGEYVLVDVEAQDETPRVTRLGRFATRGELPGGAVALDLDHDGVLDLALGVAPAQGLVHRPFSGVFWLRGRPQGGFELPRTMVEMPVVSVAAADVDGQPGSELVVLTRGDAAAQRAGELWLFAGGTSPTRAVVVPTALAPSDLAVGTPRDGLAEFWISATQPGSVLRLRFSQARGEWNKPERSDLLLRGVQAFLTPPREERALYVRYAVGVYGIEAGPVPKLSPFLEQAEIGPSAWLPVARDSKPAVLATTQQGFAWFHGSTRRDRALPAGTHARDASTTSAGAARARGVLLLETEEQDGNLALAVLPVDVPDEALEPEIRSGAVEAAPTEARVALE